MTDHELFRVVIGIIIVLGLLGAWWEVRVSKPPAHAPDGRSAKAGR
jgi:hypothetical protein